jgi:ankyrin repeat protein
MNRPEMISVLLELGADPLAVDGGGQSIASYATSSNVDSPVMERIREMDLSEISSAERGHRDIRAEPLDLIACLSLRDWETASRLTESSSLLTDTGALHVMAKRNDIDAVKWLLEHGANPNTTWAHWDADVTPLHHAALSCAVEIARLLLDAGADPGIKDTKHQGDALDWAEHFECNEMVTILKEG